jgi:hypothetical protein
VRFSLLDVSSENRVRSRKQQCSVSDKAEYELRRPTLLCRCVSHFFVS